MKIDVIKCHGSGNDFIIIDEMTKDYGLSEQDRIALAKTLCSRDKSIGSDGILFIQNSEKADGRMRMFNTDGSEAEMCGNGLRCVARFVTEKLGKNEVVIETMKAELPVKKVEDIYPGMVTFEVAIEPVSLSTETLPMISDEPEHINKLLPELHGKITFTALSVPNPHLVAVADNADADLVKETGRKANELKSVLPNGVNVSFLKPLSNSSIFVRTYERGVGLTNACGTAMSASSLVACLLGYTAFNSKINVYNPGGMVQCLVVNDDHGQYFIKLRGNATYEFEAAVDFKQEKPEMTEVLHKNMFEEEIELYSQFAGDTGKAD